MRCSKKERSRKASRRVCSYSVRFSFNSAHSIFGIAVKTAIKRFSANENQSIVSKSFVIGVTCMASIFEVLDGIQASLVILDECSQVLRF